MVATALTSTSMPSDGASIADLFSLSPQEFERAVETAFDSMGYETELTPQTGDMGADILAERAGTTFLIEVKQQRTPVGPDVVQRAVGALEYHDAEVAIIASLGGYTAGAIDAAEAGPVQLWGPEHIVDGIQGPIPSGGETQVIDGDEESFLPPGVSKEDVQGFDRIEKPLSALIHEFGPSSAEEAQIVADTLSEAVELHGAFAFARFKYTLSGTPRLSEDGELSVYLEIPKIDAWSQEQITREDIRGIGFKDPDEPDYPFDISGLDSPEFYWISLGWESDEDLVDAVHIILYYFYELLAPFHSPGQVEKHDLLGREEPWTGKKGRRPDLSVVDKGTPLDLVHGDVEDFIGTLRERVPNWDENVREGAAAIRQWLEGATDSPLNVGQTQLLHWEYLNDGVRVYVGFPWADGAEENYDPEAMKLIETLFEPPATNPAEVPQYWRQEEIRDDDDIQRLSELLWLVLYRTS